MLFRGRRYQNAFIVSAIAHCALAALAVVAARYASTADEATRRVAARDPGRLVWLVSPAHGRGGGGGGNNTPRPARRLQRGGRDPRAVPAGRSAPPAAAREQVQADAAQRLDIPAVPSLSGLVDLPGALVAHLPAEDSQGPGRDGGAGAGRLGGIGPGAGPGLEAGQGGNTGSGPRRPGGGVSDPVLIHETKPAYTQQAMQAHVHGLVELDAVVLPDGRVGSVRIARSLDSRFGLDERAVEAVKAWRFRPALLAGQPVAVLVRIELTFTLR
jgi:protein TonB